MTFVTTATAAIIAVPLATLFTLAAELRIHVSLAQGLGLAGGLAAAIIVSVFVSGVVFGREPTPQKFARG